MFLRHTKNRQVKCNFCLEWMRINVQVQCNINICNTCLDLGYRQNKLHVVSSTGDIYQLYVIKQNLTFGFEESDQEKYSQNEGERKQKEMLENQYQENQTKEFFQSLDTFRNSDINNALLKWKQFSNYVSERQKLNSNQISQLKDLCRENVKSFEKMNTQFFSNIKYVNQHQKVQLSPRKNRLPLGEIEININSIERNLNNVMQQQVKTCKNKQQKLKEVKQSISIIKRSDKQNYSQKQCVSNQSYKLNQKLKQINLQISVQSEHKMKFLQVINPINNQNILQSPILKVQLLQNQDSMKQTHFLLDKVKDVQIQQFKEQSYHDDSFINKELMLSFRSNDNSRVDNFFNILSKRSKNQLLTKYALIKKKIFKYLKQNYQSSPLSRLMLGTVFQTYQNTAILGKSLELVSYSLKNVDFKCYLLTFDWKQVQILKLVKTKISDNHLKILMQFLNNNEDQMVKTLVLTNNRITEKSIELINQKLPSTVKQIYLGRNMIKKYKVSNQIRSLSEKCTLYL